MRLAWLVFSVALAGFVVAPAAAVVADVITFTPLSLQPETDAVIFTPIALYYLPAWALLVGAGIGARRVQRRWRPSPNGQEA